jgi:hypothetical protein
MSGSPLYSLQDDIQGTDRQGQQGISHIITANSRHVTAWQEFQSKCHEADAQTIVKKLNPHRKKSLFSFFFIDY